MKEEPSKFPLFQLDDEFNESQMDNFVLTLRQPTN